MWHDNWRGHRGRPSREWEQLLDGERARLGLYFDTDGEWWMEVGDFLRCFDQVPRATRWTVFVLTRVSSWSCATCRTPTRGGWTAGTAPGDPDTRRGDPGNTWHVARV